MKHFATALLLFWGFVEIYADYPTCPELDERATYFADPYNCSQYYECSNGIRNHMTCPEDLYWNDILTKCDYLENVDCNSHSTTSLPTDTTPTPRCPYDPDKIVYSVDPNDCKSFYECYLGYMFWQTCPNDTYWNHLMNYCDDFENVDCSRSSTTEAPNSLSPLTTPAADICGRKPDGTLVPDPTHKTHFTNVWLG
ncbi:peritrophin-1 [Leptinotarsa decemlineata]|uniref:peritrophin-1 n=1 Tax=Leptinotarsa decemlineata TaxID=7539 RepID=UPI003D3092EF